MADTDRSSDAPDTKFADLADQRNAGVLREIWELARESRKWWLVPIVIVLLVLALLLILGSTAAAPFIYQLF